MSVSDNHILIGVDEAGRGSIIGDLVIALTAIPVKNIENLRNYGVKDSKKLTPKRRMELLKLIFRESILILTSHIPPLTIDKIKINKLELMRVASMINNALKYIDAMLDNKCSVGIYIDEIKGFKDQLKRLIMDRYKNLIISEIVMEPKADEKYIPVAAASIIAKTYRDLNIKFGRVIHGDYGSGYPSDPRTRSWIIECYNTYREPPSILRRSWGSLLKIAPSWYSNIKHGRSILDYISGKGRG